MASGRANKAKAALDEERRSLSFRPHQRPLGTVFTTKHCRLGLSDVASFFDDWRNFRVGEVTLEALFVPIEDDPNSVGFLRIAKDGRALGTVLLALIGAFGREDFQKA